MRVRGVIDILTHQHRPPKWPTATTPTRTTPRRKRVRPIARFTTTGSCSADSRSPLVLAEDWETARFAASLVRVEYQREAHVTDLHAQRGEAFAVEKPEKPRGNAEKAFAAADVRHEAEYFIPTEHHNPMELFGSTAMWEDGKLTVYDKTQGVQNVQRYLCGVFDLKPDEVRVLSPYMGGGFGAALRPQYQVVLAVLGARARSSGRCASYWTREQMYALGYRPATIERLALGANGPAEHSTPSCTRRLP